MSQFNEGVDAVVLKPGATLYRENVPPLVRTGVSNFFGNLGDAWSAVNSALQLKVQDAAENAMRFSVNTFFGLGGILDIASEMNIERHREDFGQTLGHWGVPSGPYVVLPLLGPSTLRDSLALPVDYQGDLVRETRSFGRPQLALRAAGGGHARQPAAGGRRAGRGRARQVQLHARRLPAAPPRADRVGPTGPRSAGGPAGDDDYDYDEDDDGPAPGAGPASPARGSPAPPPGR